MNSLSRCVAALRLDVGRLNWVRPGGVRSSDGLMVLLPAATFAMMPIDPTW